MCGGYVACVLWERMPVVRQGCLQTVGSKSRPSGDASVRWFTAACDQLICLAAPAGSGPALKEDVYYTKSTAAAHAYAGIRMHNLQHRGSIRCALRALRRRNAAPFTMRS